MDSQSSRRWVRADRILTARPPQGRAPGQKNLSIGETKREIKAFFQELTIDSMHWRKNVKMHIEQAPDPREFRFWSTIALSYRFGVPGKMAAEGVDKNPLIFATLNGYLPYDDRVDPGAARSRQLNAAKAEELKLQALEAKGEAIADRRAEHRSSRNGPG
jgi:hypothetical protein